MPRLLFAVLAHANRPCLDDLLANVRQAAPGSPIVLYDGGRDPGFARDLDVPRCPYSRPLHHDWITPFPYGVMRWAAEEGVAYDRLVTLECDMLLLRPGLAERLDRVMGDSDFLATHFTAIDSWRHPWSIGRRARWQWHRSGWADLIGTDRPYGAFGPGQVMGRRYVERLLALPRLPEIVDRAQASRLRALSEVVYPSLAVALGCRPMRDPASRALLLRRHPAADLVSFAADPDVHLVHKVGMRVDDPDRVFVREACRTGTPDPVLLRDQPEPATGLRQRARRLPRRVRRKLRRGYRDVEAALLPERRRRPLAELEARHVR